MELIDRDELLKEYDLAHCVKYGNKDAKQQYHSYDTLMMYEIADMIRDAPSVEAEPIRHGRWEERNWEDARADSGLHTIASARCSECCLWCEQVRDWTARVEYKFCPSCGARMDGGAENG